MPIYDEVSAHHARLPGDLPKQAASTHIGLFLAWALARGLGSPMHARKHGDALARLGRRWTTGRDYLLEALDGVLADEHLVDDGDAFAEAYYVSGDYLRDYEEHLRGHSPSIYHVRDDWSNFDKLAPILDSRFAEWQATRTKPPPPAEAPAPEGIEGARRALHEALPEHESVAREAPSVAEQSPPEPRPAVETRRPDPPVEARKPPTGATRKPAAKEKHRRRQRTTALPPLFRSHHRRRTRTSMSNFARVLLIVLICLGFLMYCSERRGRERRKKPFRRGSTPVWSREVDEFLGKFNGSPRQGTNSRVQVKTPARPKLAAAQEQVAEGTEAGLAVAEAGPRGRTRSKCSRLRTLCRPSLDACLPGPPTT